MKEVGYGRVVNVISTSVRIPLKGLGVSNTIRGAVASWAKTVSNEVAGFGITVNNVLPGATETERLHQIIANKAQKTASGTDEVADAMRRRSQLDDSADPKNWERSLPFSARQPQATSMGSAFPWTVAEPAPSDQSQFREMSMPKRPQSNPLKSSLLLCARRMSRALPSRPAARTAATQ